MDLSLTKINDEVFIASDEIVRLDSRGIDFVKESALTSPRGRARICMHKKSSDTLHEMLIGIRGNSYIRPHRHNKVESFHWVEGAADIVVLKEDGDIADVIAIGPGQSFYYRLDTPKYHTLLINSPVLIIHEITNGPFDPTQSDFASFSPAEGAPEVIDYIEQLKLKAAIWKNK